jgi:aldose 1-epimerase
VSGYSASGEQWQIRSGPHVATVVEVGGGLREYTVDGVPQVFGYALDQQAPNSAGAVLVPWPNRIRDGKYSLDRTGHQLPLTEPKSHNAIHGLLRWVSWRPTAVADDAVTLECTVHPQPGYPNRLSVQLTYTVGGDGLRVDILVWNTGLSAAPFGFGAHPYLYVEGVAVDDLLLHLPGATQRLVTDARGLPADRADVAGTEYDFTEPRPLGGVRLDTAFGGVRGEATLSAVDGRGVRLWMGEGFRWVQVFTSDVLPEPRRRRAVAVEPMTCPPDAFNSGEDLIRLTPGDTWQGSWGLSPLA